MKSFPDNDSVALNPDGVSAADFLPLRRSISALRRAAEDCRGCELYRRATQVVFSEGRAKADLMIIGETPGDREDREGRPFVGPAGMLLDEALTAAGLNRSEMYLTNVVKHFKWEERGKRRLNSKPNSRQIAACRRWLEAEIEVLKPETIVCLGATAAQALLGRQFRITKQRGHVMATHWAPVLLATYPPSAILRAPDKAARQRMREEFFNDLQTAAGAAVNHRAGRRSSLQNQDDPHGTSRVSSQAGFRPNT